MDLAAYLVQLRTRRGISQAELAEALGVSRQSVSKWETGASVPDLDKLVKLADFYGVTLDELVRGAAPQQEQPNPVQTVPAAPLTSGARKAGVFLLCFSAVAGLIFAVLFGLFGLAFVIPTLTAGLICYFCKKHPVLKAVWAAYLILSFFSHMCTGISPSLIFRTFRWTAQMNYAILVFSWIWFGIIAALIAGTARVLREEKWTWTRRQTGWFGAAVVLFLAGMIPIPFSEAMYREHNTAVGFLYVLQKNISLLGLAALVSDLTRWIHTRKIR